MAKKIKQFILTGENANLSANDDGDIVINQYSITQLGIQGLPGTQFYINGASKPALIGYTGVFELNFDNQPIITSLIIKSEWLENNEESNTTMIIDIVYEEG